MADESSPKLVLENFITLSNDRNPTSHNQATSALWFTIADGKPSIFDARSDMIDFDGLADTGLGYTAIGSIEVLHSDASTVLLKAIVERFDADDQVIFNGEFVVLLTGKIITRKSPGGFRAAIRFSRLENKYLLRLRGCCAGHRPRRGAIAFIR